MRRWDPLVRSRSPILSAAGLSHRKLDDHSAVRCDSQWGFIYNSIQIIFCGSLAMTKYVSCLSLSRVRSFSLSGAAQDLPGFYYDAEKNRYFPIKGPIPGSKRTASAALATCSSSSKV
ncbi:hypothetical protein FCM35_KLT01100 [Carex littledalei]|uniref:Uncharacterized protein n=1 Tax=Carex littledalei TaxID=544730 RepID=A0A833RD09_9POAL|nr:hypothetical protein FCM35_KLT01100 [Carex littledalei]